MINKEDLGFKVKLMADYPSFMNEICVCHPLLNKIFLLAITHCSV